MCAKRQICEHPVIISVDSYESKIMKGRLWDGYEYSETKFTGLMQLLLLIEKILSETKQPTEEKYKSFVRPDPTAIAENILHPADPTRGTLATFRLRVMFCQNTSWQGILTWVEARQEESYRSVLEFAILLDSALSYASEAKSQ